MAGADHHGPDPSAPIKESPGASPAASASSVNDDPMASIRPELPSSMPLLTPTVALTDHASHGDSTQGASEAETRQTHNSGLFVLRVLPPATVEDAAETVQAEPNAKADAEIHAPYQLLERIGVGGMGEVWEAQQRSLERHVALKRLREGKKMPRSVRAQFESEARLTAILDHPNIVTVYELGLDQSGRVFYTMKRIEGTPWLDLISAGQRPTGEVLELRDHLDILIEVSQAVAFAHSRGVIHRDIKPGNVMIGNFGEVLLVDWGLAVAMAPLRGLDKDKVWILAELPRSALTCGTPAYMAPETAMARRERIGPATDVYLLGAVLFHLLYGRPPHRGKTVKQVIAQAKVNAWTYPSSISGRLKPWDALLRPVINRALATDPVARYSDASAFGEALRQATRNYDSAKVATRAQEELDSPKLRATTDAGNYHSLIAIIARLEAALESWPGNLAARRTLAQAHLEMASLALANDDLALAELSIDSFEQLPPIPEPEQPPRRFTLHPVDGTLIGAPKPTDSLIAAGTSNEWVSSAGGSKASSRGGLAATVGAAEMAQARTLDADGKLVGLGRSPVVSSLASVMVQQRVSESMLDEERQLEVQATRLRHKIGARDHGTRRRRLSLRLAAGLAAVLATAVVAVAITAHLTIAAERDRARAERDELSRVLLDETADTVEARLAIQLDAVHGAMTTALRWAAQGSLDSDDPRELNRYFMPLLEGVGAASSVLRADSAGNEYMLLRHSEGWRTRVTAPAQPPQLRDWSPTGEARDGWNDAPGYDPHTRPWYRDGEALRGAARRARLDGQPTPVAWTSPYRSLTTTELRMSISAPATNGSGRPFVIAFDVKLGDLSRVTATLPAGVVRGQTFVLDEELRLLGLPRETMDLATEAREGLLLTALAEAEAAPLSRAALVSWSELDQSEEPFDFEHEGERYWARFRHNDGAARPKVWIGVVVPESDFLDAGE